MNVITATTTGSGAIAVAVSRKLRRSNTFITVAELCPTWPWCQRARRVRRGLAGPRPRPEDRKDLRRALSERPNQAERKTSARRRSHSHTRTLVSRCDFGTLSHSLVRSPGLDSSHSFSHIHRPPPHWPTLKSPPRRVLTLDRVAPTPTAVPRARPPRQTDIECHLFPKLLLVSAQLLVR